MNTHGTIWTVSIFPSSHECSAPLRDSTTSEWTIFLPNSIPRPQLIGPGLKWTNHSFSWGFFQQTLMKSWPQCWHFWDVRLIPKPATSLTTWKKLVCMQSEVNRKGKRALEILESLILPASYVQLYPCPLLSNQGTTIQWSMAKIYKCFFPLMIDKNFPFVVASASSIGYPAGVIPSTSQNLLVPILIRGHKCYPTSICLLMRW